jgi:hypothetical protein
VGWKLGEKYSNIPYYYKTEYNRVIFMGDLMTEHGALKHLTATESIAKPAVGTAFTAVGTERSRFLKI